MKPKNSLFTRTLSVSPTASVTTSNNLNGDLYVAQFDAHDGAGVKVRVTCMHCWCW